MNKHLMELTLKIRATVYILGTFALLAASLTSCKKKEPISCGAWVSNQMEKPIPSFWPPDLVPHPRDPSDGKEDEGGGWA